MKSIVWLLVISLSIAIACNSARIFDQTKPAMTKSLHASGTQKVKVHVGNKSFLASLADNAAAKSFAAQLPLTLTMKELNSNEKFAQLPQRVPTQASIPARIESGDLMMYGSTTLVLFYKGFTTSYSYTQIGKIEDVTGLTAALGTGDVSVRFEIQND